MNALDAKRAARSTTRRWLAVCMMLGLLLPVAGCEQDGGNSNDTQAVATSPQADTQDDRAAQDLDTLEPGTVVVAIRGDLPFAAREDGQLTGIDGDIMRSLAERLGLEVKIEVMDFSGQLGAIESRRVDVAIGSIGWSQERAQAGLFTDPVYYAGPRVVQAEDSNLQTFADLEGKRIGTVTGYAWVPGLEAIPGAKVRTYETADAVYQDVGAGRIDAAFVDTLQDIYTANVRPELGIKAVPLEISEEQIQQNEAFSIFSKLQFPFFVPKESPALEAALTEQIREMYEDGELAEIVDEWGLDPERALTPGEKAAGRAGVDRPDGWEPPHWEPSGA